MSLVVVCPQCQQQYGAPAEAAGRAMNCPQCQALMQVPGAPAVQQRAPLTVACPYCRQQFASPRELLGQQVPCPSCQAPIHIAENGSAIATNVGARSSAAPARSNNLVLIIAGSLGGAAVMALLLAMVVRSFLAGPNQPTVAELPAEVPPPVVISPDAPGQDARLPRTPAPFAATPQSAPAQTEAQLLEQVAQGKINGIEFFEQLEKLKAAAGDANAREAGNGASPAGTSSPATPARVIDGNTLVKDVSQEELHREIQRRFAERAAARSGNNPAQAAALQNIRDRTVMVQQVGAILKSIHDVPTAQAGRVKLAPWCEPWVKLHQEPSGAGSGLPAMDEFVFSKSYFEAFFVVGKEMQRIEKLSPQVNAELADFKVALMGGQKVVDRAQDMQKKLDDFKARNRDQ